MELNAVIASRLVGDGGERRAITDCDGFESRRQGGDAVAVAHPYGNFIFETVEKFIVLTFFMYYYVSILSLCTSGYSST